LPGGQGGGNTGAFTVVNRYTGEIVFQDEHGAYRSPICAGDTIYVVGAVDRHHQVLTARDPLGGVYWTAAKNLGRGTGSPALGHGVLVSPGSDGTIEAFDATTGENLWSHPVGTALFDIIAGTLGWGSATFSTPAIADSVVFVGSADGYFYALDLFDGTELWNWYFGTPVSSSPALSGNMVFVGASDGHLYAFAGAGSGVPTSVPGVHQESNQVRFFLPSPNPSKGTCNFYWAMRTSTVVCLSIYDLRGRLVRTLLHETMVAGEHEMSWDGMDRMGKPVAAGVYIVSFVAGSHRDVLKLIYLKN
jgi:hypothetical protein